MSDPESVPVPRIGVFGGLFNPPHIGHLSLCQEAAWQLGLDRVVLVPTGRPSHRSAPRESPEMRLRLAQAAALGNPMFTVSRLEIDRLGPSYTVDTLRELSHRYPGSSLHLLIGADQLAAMDTWHEPAAIAQLARIAAALRPGIDVARARRRRTSTGSRCRRSASRRRSCASVSGRAGRSATSCPTRCAS